MPDNKIITDREKILKAVKKDGWALKDASDTLKADREVVLEAVRKDGRALKFADDILKADREFVLEAVKFDGRAFEYASDTLKADRELVLEAVKNKGFALESASDTLKADREVVLEAVKNKGFALQYASDTLKADREVVLEAVKNGGALESASDTLKADREVVLEAVRNDAWELKYADASFTADREVVLAAVKQNPCILELASEELQNDPELKKLAEGDIKTEYQPPIMTEDEDILTKHFADALGSDYATAKGYYGEWIAAIEDKSDIKQFAEDLTEELQADYAGDLNEEERAKFHYALMFNTMTIAWKRMLKEEITTDWDKEQYSEDDLDETKGLVSNKDWVGPDG